MPEQSSKDKAQAQALAAKALAPIGGGSLLRRYTEKKGIAWNGEAPPISATLQRLKDDRGPMEWAPMNGWAMRVYDDEQQQRLLIDERGLSTKPSTLASMIDNDYEAHLEQFEAVKRSIADFDGEMAAPPASSKDAPEPVTVTGLPRSRIPGAKVLEEPQRRQTGPYCIQHRWYWDKPAPHGRFEYSTGLTDYHLNGSPTYAFGEINYGRERSIGYPYPEWRHFPYNPNHNLAPTADDAQAGRVSRVNMAQINQAAAEEWQVMEQQIREGVKERQAVAAWLQAGYGNNPVGRGPAPYDTRRFLEH